MRFPSEQLARIHPPKDAVRARSVLVPGHDTVRGAGRVINAIASQMSIPTTVVSRSYLYRIFFGGTTNSS